MPRPGGLMEIPTRRTNSADVTIPQLTVASSTSCFDSKSLITADAQHPTFMEESGVPGVFGQMIVQNSKPRQTVSETELAAAANAVRLALLQDLAIEICE